MVVSLVSEVGSLGSNPGSVTYWLRNLRQVLNLSRSQDFHLYDRN